MDHVSGRTIPWEPNAEQVKYWNITDTERLVYILKGRQVGTSTGAVFEDSVVTALHDAAGQPYKTALIWDTEAKIKEQIRKCSDFLSQLGLKHKKRVTSIEFPNGSAIDGLTAGGKSVGRGMSYQRFHCSELPWWSDATETWSAVQAALGLEGVCIVETTMSMRDPLASNLWHQKNDYAKIFFPVEMHKHEYSRDASDLKSEDEEWLRSEGFTDPEVMSWWLWTLENKFAGDKIIAFREFPQKPEHAFMVAEGRWFRASPTVVDPLRFHLVPGLDGEQWRLSIFIEPTEGSGDYIIGVDTATGRDLDRSALAVVDRRTGRLCASFVSERCAGDNLAVVTKAAHDFYSTVVGGGRVRPTDRVPVVIIERNGVGEETCRQARRLGVPVRDIYSDETTIYAQMLMVRRAVENGDIFGPPELLEEAMSCYVKNGRWRGTKDLSCAIGFALAERERTPYLEPRKDQTPRFKLPGRDRFAAFKARSTFRW